jgi:DNA-binding transcriptional MerR regulator
MHYNAKAASTVTGVPISTLRTWERRYGVPAPGRTKTGQRLYTQQDIELVREMSHLLERGIVASLAAQAVRGRLLDEQRVELEDTVNLLLTLSKVAAHFPNGSINIFDRDLRYVFAEGLGLGAIGLSSDSLVGKTLYDLFPPDSVAVVQPPYERAFAGESVVFELYVAGHTYSIAAGPLEVNENGVQTIIAVAQDISAWQARLAK